MNDKKCLNCTFFFNVILFNAQVGSLMEVLQGLGSLVQLDLIRDQFTRDIDSEFHDICDEDCISNWIKGITITIGFSLFINTIMAIFSGLMLYGIKKKKANFMTPYIYFMFGTIGLAGLATVGFAVVCMVYLSVVAGLFIAGIVGGFLALQFYFIRVVKLHKEEVSFFMSFCDRNIRNSLYNWVEHGLLKIFYFK